MQHDVLEKEGIGIDGEEPFADKSGGGEVGDTGAERSKPETQKAPAVNFTKSGAFNLSLSLR